MKKLHPKIKSIKAETAWAISAKSPKLRGFLLTNERYEIFSNRTNAAVHMMNIGDIGIELSVIKVKITPL